METLLIAGGCGFVGKNLIEKFHSEYQVVVIDRKIDEVFLSQFPGVRAYGYDFSDPAVLRHIISESHPDLIVNLVSVVTAERDLSLFDALINTNLKTMLELFHACRDSERLKLFVQFGSAEEYGNIRSPFSETDREQPNSPYALLKQLTTNTAMMLHQNYGFPTVVVRPGNIFGKYQPETKLIPYLVSQLKSNNPLRLSPGEQKRDFIHISDFADALGALFQKRESIIGSIINISYGHGERIRDVVEYLKVKLDSKSELGFGAIPYRENEMIEFECDINRLRALTGFEFTRSLYEALDDYLRSIIGATV